MELFCNSGSLEILWSLAKTFQHLPQLNTLTSLAPSTVPKETTPKVELPQRMDTP
jgi:hypothetical protein